MKKMQLMKKGTAALLVLTVIASSLSVTPSQAAQKKAVLAKKNLTMTVKEKKQIKIKKKLKGAKYS